MAIDVATYYRRRCSPSRLKLSLWHDRTWFDGWVIKGMVPDDPFTDKEPKAYVLELVRHYTRGGLQGYEYADRVVARDAVIHADPGDPGLREVR